MAMEERDLVERFAQNGDPRAFSMITARYADFVYSTCRRILHNDAEAADAAQETFYQLVKDARSVNGSLLGWLHQVATRRAVDLIRQNSSRRRREQVYVEEVETKASSWAEIEPVVDEAMEELPESYRELLVQHFLERQSMTGAFASPW